MPVSPSAGQRVTETGAPLCTPVPVSEISLASVVWRAPIKPLIPRRPPSRILSSLLARGLPSDPPIDLRSSALERDFCQSLRCAVLIPQYRSVKNLNAGTQGRQITVSFSVLRTLSSHNALIALYISPS